MGLFDSIEALHGLVDFNSWAKVSFLPIGLMSMLLIFGGYLIFKPKKEITISKDAFRSECAKLPPFSRGEKYTAIILSVCFCLFFTGQIHHIPDAAICLGGLFALSSAGVIKANEIGRGINWDLVLFIGVALGIGSVCNDTGVSKWLAGILVPTLKPFVANPWLFTYVIILVLFIWRFIDVAVLLPTMAILVPILPEISNSYGINPLIWIPLLIMASNCFFLSYQNMFALVAESSVPEKCWNSRHFTSLGVIYFIACLVALLVSIPYWISIGMFW